MVSRCHARSVFATPAAKWLAALVIVMALVPLTASFTTADAAEFSVERDLHIGGNQSAGSIELLADCGPSSTTSVFLGVQLRIDATTVAGGVDQRRFRVRVLRI
jgi:hypothetical protein